MLLDIKAEIKNLLEEYDQKKGWRRWFSWFPWLGYHSDIRKLRNTTFYWHEFIQLLWDTKRDSDRLSSRLITNLYYKLSGIILKDANDVRNYVIYRIRIQENVFKEVLQDLGLQEVASNKYPLAGDQSYRFVRSADAFSFLQNNNCLTYDTAAILFHDNPSELSKGLICLEKANLKTDQNRSAIINHTLPRELAKAYVAFAEVGLLERYREFLKTYTSNTELLDIVNGINKLRLAGILTEQNIIEMMTHENPSRIVSTLVNLSECNRNPEIRAKINEISSRIKASRDSEEVSWLIRELAHTDFINDAFLKAVIEHRDPLWLCLAFSKLKEEHIFNEQIVSEIMTHATPQYLANIYGILHRRNLFTAANRQAWRQMPFSVLNDIYLNIPVYRINQTVNDEFIRLGTMPGLNEIQRRRNCEEYFMQVMLQPQRTPVNPRRNNLSLNSAQSKHKSCVEHSVAESAVRLNELYGKDMDVEKVLKEIEAWVNALGDDETSAKAKLAFPRLRDSTYTNPASGISTPQVLALVWCAIHDDEKRAKDITIEEAKQKLAYALFDCQCSYNFDDNDQYIGGEDQNTCVAGEFISIVTNMGNDVHPAIKIIYIAEIDDVEKIKLPDMVRKQAAAFLQAEQKNAITPEKQLAFNQLLSDFRNEGISFIWEKIKTAVFDLFFKKYGSHYNNDKNAHLKAIVAAQEYLSINEMDKFLSQNNIAELKVTEVEKATPAEETKTSTAPSVSISGSAATTGFFSTAPHVTDTLEEFPSKRFD